MSSIINQFSNELLFDYLQQCPDFAADLGIYDIEGRHLAGNTLPDYSDDGIAKRCQLVADRSQALKNIDTDTLTPDEKITFQVMDYLLNEGSFPAFPGVRGHHFPVNPYPITHLSGPHVKTMALLTNGHPIVSLHQAEDFVIRLSLLPEAIAQTIDALKSRRIRQIITPSHLLHNVVKDIEKFLTDDVEDNIYYTNLRYKLNNTDIEKPKTLALLQEAKALLKNIIYPKYQSLLNEIKLHVDDDEQNLGYWHLPDGDEFYAWILRTATTTNMSPEEVHELGLAEIDRLKNEIETAFKEIGISGPNISTLYNQLESKPSASYADSEAGRRQLLTDARHIVSQIQSQCRHLFNMWPETGITVDPVPGEIEDSMHSTYVLGDISNNTPASFQLNITHSLIRAKWELPTLCHHEAYPGHHLQLALAKELTNLPVFRRHMTFAAYLEGWAKYAETLPFTHGLIDDTDCHLGRLRSELYSTVNLALDTGIHWKRWSREQAISFFKLHTGVNHEFASIVADRSAARPGQLCAYKIGMLKMQEYLARFKEARKAEFSIQEFHDTILSHGALPLKLLDSIVADILE